SRWSWTCAPNPVRQVDVELTGLRTGSFSTRHRSFQPAEHTSCLPRGALLGQTAPVNQKRWDWQPVFLELTDIPLWLAARPGSAKSQVWLEFPTSVYAHSHLGSSLLGLLSVKAKRSATSKKLENAVSPELCRPGWQTSSEECEKR
ncbi:mCG144760, partial [Mus musculus]